MGDIIELGDPCEDIGYLLWRISKFWQRSKFRILDEYNLTVPQMEILGAIYHMSIQKMNISQIVLSQQTEIDPMTTSTILKNLEKKGLISRMESKVDTRARVAEITEEGRALFIKAVTKVKTEQEEAFKGIDKKAMTKQLNILLDRLEIHKKYNN